MCRSRFFPVVGLAMLLLGCGGDRVDELAAQLGDSDVQVRRAAARSLKEYPGDKRPAMSALVTAATGNNDLEVRKLSLQALGTMGPRAQECVAQLIPLLEDSEESVRIVAALALARIVPENETCRPVIMNSMRAGNGGVLLEVGRLGTNAKWAVPMLITLVSHELVQVRSLAAHTLGEIGPAASDAVPALERMSHDGDAAVRAVALQALEKVRLAQSKSR